MSKKPVAVMDEEEEESTSHKKYPHEEKHESPLPPAPSKQGPDSKDSVQPLAGAAPPTISTFKSTNDEVGARSAGATGSPGLATAGTVKPSGYAPNGGVPVLSTLMPFGADGLSHYLPMPVGSVLLEAQVFVVTAGASTAVKLGNDTTAGAADLGTANVSTVGPTNIPLTAAVVAGTTGPSLQVTVGSDPALQCVLAVQYLVMR